MKVIGKSKWMGEMTNNIHTIIQGDNKQVLQEISTEFQGKIACIYIDPPYNNGENYTFYSDAFNQNWIVQIKEILGLLWPLLKRDGSIWISIDDGEMPYLKILCDQVFGKSCFVSTIIWQQRNTRENRKAFSNNHEYILVYSPNPKAFAKKRNLLPATSEVLSRYDNLDNDPRGPWQSVTANVQNGHAVASQYYEIVAPNGKHHTPPDGRCWVYNQKRMQTEIENNNIWFGKDGNGVPRIKRFLSDSQKGLVPETLWLSGFAGTNKDAKTHLRKLQIYDKALFDTPKPEQLVYRVLQIASTADDIVMDVFLGSGTTAAVAHKMNRNYIGIEISEKTMQYILQRMEKVIQGEQGGISKIAGWRGGGDFNFIKWENS